MNDSFGMIVFLKGMIVFIFHRKYSFGVYKQHAVITTYSFLFFLYITKNSYNVTLT